MGKDFKNNPVTYADMLPMMVQWWEQRSMQLRTDCIITNGGSTNGEDKACLDTPMVPGGIPVCYIMADGWDAMEGSVSGNGCRPTIGAMMISEAEAIATVANATGNATLAAVFTKRAEIVKEFWLANMWNEESRFIGVYATNSLHPLQVVCQLEETGMVH